MAGLPQASDTFQVLVIVPLQLLPTNGPSTPATEPPASQLSVQVKSVIAGTSPIHCTLTADGAASNTGAILSLTVIICVLVMAGFPLASDTLQVLVIVPPQLPPTNEPSTPATEPPALQLSVQVKLVIAGTFAIHCTLTADGAAANTGGVASFTETTLVQVELQPSLTIVNDTVYEVLLLDPA